MRHFGAYTGKLANPDVVGQLIEDVARRHAWIELVHALQLASETIGGPLEGWVFHGTDGLAAQAIEVEGLRRSYAIISTHSDEWDESQGVHFGSANVAAFFAEDRIESLEDAEIELVIFGAPLSAIQNIGTLAPDAQMLDCPLYSRLKVSTENIDSQWMNSTKGWQAGLQLLETVVVLNDVAPRILTSFRCVDDVDAYIKVMNNCRDTMR